MSFVLSIEQIHCSFQPSLTFLHLGRSDRLSRELSRVHEAKNQLQRQCTDLRDTLTIMSEKVVESREKQLELESDYIALQKSAEVKVKTATFRLDEVSREKKALEEKLGRLHANFDGVDPTQIMKDFKANKTELASALVEIKSLQGTVAKLQDETVILGAKIREMNSMHTVVSSEVKLIENDRRLLSKKLDQAEEALSLENKRRQTLEKQIQSMGAKYDIVKEDYEKTMNQKQHLSQQLTKIIRERDEFRKKMAV